MVIRELAVKLKMAFVEGRKASVIAEVTRLEIEIDRLRGLLGLPKYPRAAELDALLAFDWSVGD